jgi:predicted ATPase
VAQRRDVLLAIPGRANLRAGRHGHRAYNDLDAVRLTRGFFEAPDHYLRPALKD